MINYYKNIITDFETFQNTLPDSNKSILYSFAFKFDGINWSSFINRAVAEYSDLFFFRSANKQQTLIGVNSALILQPNDAASFNSVSKNLNHWRKNFHNNWDKTNKQTVPIIFCAAKFDPNNSSSLWQDFPPIRVFIPEFIIEIKKDDAFGYFNFTLEKNIDSKSLSDKLFSYLNSLEDLVKQNNDVLTEISSVNFDDKKNFSEWSSIFKKAFGFLNEREIKKIVLSKTFNLKIDNSINWNNIIEKLNNRFPDCYLFLIKKNNSIFFGSSPEMFLKVSDNIAEVESVAGSAARSKQIESDQALEEFLKMSEKNIKEHTMVSDYISDILIKFSNNVKIIEEKQIRKLDNIQHLITRISAKLHSEINVFELIDELFPTPAVCGVPKEKAKQIIKNLESHDRGLYSGLVGVFDFEKNCELAVAIRSALVKDNLLTAFAGAGIISDSDAKEEFLEIKLKLDTILSLFTHENKS